MATRSAIAIEHTDGQVTGVYCHWDGAPSIQLPILDEHYNSLEKAQALIAPGSMSQLRTAETWASNYQRLPSGALDFDAPKTNLRDPQPLYHRERGDGMPPITHQTLFQAQTSWEMSNCEHLYVFREGYGWFHYDLLDPDPDPNRTEYLRNTGWIKP